MESGNICNKGDIVYLFTYSKLGKDRSGALEEPVRPKGTFLIS